MLSSPILLLDETNSITTTTKDEPAFQAEPRSNITAKDDRNRHPSDSKHIDSLREILRDRVDAVNQLFPDMDRNRYDSVKDNEVPAVTFRCAVLRGGKFKSGDRITLRVLEEVHKGSFIIRKHDLIEGYCSIEDRVHITVHRVRGQSVTLHCYDLDGMKGLWFTDRGSETIGSISDELITEGSSLLSSRVGRIAKGLTSVGAESLQRKGRSTSVDIPSGHEFLLGLIIQ